MVASKRIKSSHSTIFGKKPCVSHVRAPEYISKFYVSQGIGVAVPAICNSCLMCAFNQPNSSVQGNSCINLSFISKLNVTTVRRIHLYCHSDNKSGDYRAQFSHLLRTQQMILFRLNEDLSFQGANRRWSLTLLDLYQHLVSLSKT